MSEADVSPRYKADPKDPYWIMIAKENAWEDLWLAVSQIEEERRTGKKNDLVGLFHHAGGSRRAKYD